MGYDQYDGAAGSAISTLTHYFKTAFLAAGLNWNSDNNAEMEALVGSLLAEVKRQTNPCNSEIDNSPGDDQFDDEDTEITVL